MQLKMAEDGVRAKTVALMFRQQVSELYDEYAPTYEEHLLGELGYEGPQLIVEQLSLLLLSTHTGEAEEDNAEKSVRGASPDPATTPPLSEVLCVDLGCGTGLAGKCLRPVCSGELVGCDLSKRMLKVAKKKKVYDDLKAGDAVAYLTQCLEPASADLIVAADVIVYSESASVSIFIFLSASFLSFLFSPLLLYCLSLF
jgi:predicted TPR repeat methyltransferase